MQFSKFKVLAAAMALGMVLAGCGKEAPPAAKQQEVLVNAFKAYTSDTPLMKEYSGTIIAQQEVPVQARVSGYIVEKYVQGGQYVNAGQALYRIDPRQYESSLLASQANVAQAKANYENAMKDLERYRMLLAEGAISDQQYRRQETMVEQYRAVVSANEAQATMAADNVGDTIVRAPFSGTLGVNDLPVGNFVAAGATPLVTISSLAPIYVRFDLTEDEYLKMTRAKADNSWGKDLKLRLADGSVYDELGEVTVVDQGSNSGQFTVKASFPNSNRVLRPGMFVSVISDTEIAHNSVLVPTKAVQPLLDKEFVNVVDADNKVKQKPIKTGGTFGYYTVVTEGLKSGEVVIVEGQNKVRSGQTVKVNMLDKAQIEQPAAAGQKKG